MILELFLSAVLQTQVPPAAKLGDSIAWDKSDAEMLTEEIVNFSICLDAQPCVSVTPAASKSATVAASYTWKLPALTIGPHVVTVQACNAEPVRPRLRCPSSC